MARPRNSFPKFSVDATGRAFTKVSGRFISLGRADDPESQIRFADVLKRHAAGESVAPKKSTDASGGIPVNVLLVRFCTEELPRYSAAEQFCLKGAIRILRQSFGDTPTAEFGPLKLRAVRDAMVKGDATLKDNDGKPSPRKPWSRGFTNHQIRRLRTIFRWGVSWELVPQTVVDALATLTALKPGETEAVDYRPRRAVPDADVAAVRAILPELHRDLLDLLMLTGARSGELLGLTTGDLDRSGDVWRAVVERHKTRHKGKSRTLFFNRAAQSILLRYLKADSQAKLFDIRRDSFGSAVKRACIKADVPIFTPHWIRHTVATKLADEMGTEAAQRLLGHAGKAMTEHYSKSAERLATEAAKRLG